MRQEATEVHKKAKEQLENEVVELANVVCVCVRVCVSRQIVQFDAFAMWLTIVTSLFSVANSKAAQMADFWANIFTEGFIFFYKRFCHW